MNDNDEIVIDDIRCYGRHGAYPGEKDQAQPFHLKLRLLVDLWQAAESDSLLHTVDYAVIHSTIVDIVENTSFNLLERLASEILTRVLADARIIGATLSIGKPARLNGATATVSLQRNNHGRVTTTTNTNKLKGNP